MIKKLLLTTVILVCFYSCGNDSQPKVVYDSTESEKKPKEEDTTLIQIADLPIRIDSTEYLIHPIGTYRIYKHRSKIISSSDYGRDDVNFSISNTSQYEIRGNLTNLKFQHIDSKKLSALTDQNIKIRSATFLIDFYEKSKTAYLLYKVADEDSNKDGEIDYQDLESLYLSNIDGTGFRKLTPKYHELVNWKLITSLNRLYFKTVEDINKDGEFGRTDKVHYYYLNLKDQDPKTVEYTPLK